LEKLPRIRTEYYYILTAYNRQVEVQFMYGKRSCRYRFSIFEIPTDKLSIWRQHRPPKHRSSPKRP